MSWTLYTLNASWSLVVSTIAAIILVAARVEMSVRFFGRCTILAVGMFWAAHGIYILLNPMPLPTALAWAKFPMLMFPATLTTLHWLPLLILLREGPAPIRRLMM